MANLAPDGDRRSESENRRRTAADSDRTRRAVGSRVRCVAERDERDIG
jgi:hypothetical protein